MKPTTLVLLMAAITGVSLASPSPHHYYRGLAVSNRMEPALDQQQATPKDIGEICSLIGGDLGARPIDVYLKVCRQGAVGGRSYSFCILPLPEVFKIKCSQLKSASVNDHMRPALYQQVPPKYVVDEICSRVRAGELPIQVYVRTCLQGAGGSTSGLDFCNFPPQVMFTFKCSQLNMEPAVHQQVPTPNDISEFCLLGRNMGLGLELTPIEVYQAICYGGAAGKVGRFCDLPPQVISTIKCPPQPSSEATAAGTFSAKSQQDPAVVNPLRNVYIFCTVAKVGSSDPQMVGNLLSQLCSNAPPTESIVSVLPSEFRGMIEATAALCNLSPATQPTQFLSTVRSGCTKWNQNFSTICSAKPELCHAIFGGIPS